MRKSSSYKSESRTLSFTVDKSHKNSNWIQYLYNTVSHFSYSPPFPGPHFLTKMLESNILFDNLRIDILSVLGFHPLNINVILNGNENWNTEVNVVLFRAVHRYIHTSKRF